MKLTIDANVGLRYLREHDEKLCIWGAAVERVGIFPSIDLMGEIFGDNKSDPWVQAGARWAIFPDDVFVNVSYGAQIDRRQASLFMIGIKMAFR